MYKIIDGMKYNTDTASLIVEVRYEVGIEEECHEALYRTANGALFIAAWMGSGLDTLTPASSREALEWVEKYQDFFTIDQVIEALGGAKVLGIVDA